MASTKAAHKLHMVTLIRSGIGKPFWQKRTLEALGLTKLHKTVVHKNTPSVNGMLASVRELVAVKPVVVRSDAEKSPSGGDFLLHNGECFLSNHVRGSEDVEGSSETQSEPATQPER